MEGQYMGAAMFAFLAVAAVAVFSFISVTHWISARHQERDTKERYGLLKLLLEHPGEEGTRVMAAWREQEAVANEKERSQRLTGGAVTIAVGLALAAMLGVMAPGSGAWAVGLVPGAVGIALLAFAYFARPTA